MLGYYYSYDVFDDYDGEKGCKRARQKLVLMISNWKQQQLLSAKLWAVQHRRLSTLLAASLLLTLVWTVSCQLLLHQQSLVDRGVLRFKLPDSAYERAEALKAIMPRSPMFQNMSVEAMHQQLPVWIISLARASKRRQHMAKQIEAAGLTNIEFVDAADYRNASSYTEADLNNYVKGWRQHMWDRNQSLIRSKIGIDLSHYRLLERIIATGRPAVILEDDAQIDMMGKQWLPNLLTALQELPEDWDILYFNAVYTTRGKPVSPHLFAIRWTPSAIGYVATPAFARKVLENARSPWQNAWVDIIFELLERSQEAQAYIVQPPLVEYAPLGTTTALEAATIHYSWWEQLWFMKARHHCCRRRLRRLL